MAIKLIHIDVVVENGQLQEHLHELADRQLMVERMNKILTDPEISAAADDPKKILRDGLVQILVDQFTNNNAHVPIIFRTGDDPGDNEEQLVWHCEHAEIEVEIDKFRDTRGTPHQPNLPGNPFKFDATAGGNKGKHVGSGAYKNKGDAKKQKFFKFSVEGKDFLGHDLKLDPCLICEK